MNLTILSGRSRPQRASVAGQRREERRVWRRIYAQFLLLTLVFGGLAAVTAPRPLSLTLFVYLSAAGAIIARPAAGIYIVTFFTLLGDAVISPWYPFAKNLSSRESISYVHDAIPLTPIELMLVVTVVAWLLRSYATHTWHVRRGRVLWPALLFGGFLVLGLVRGVLGGGDLRIAMFESRAMFYLPTLYFLIVQLFTNRAQYVRLFLVAFAAIFGQSLLAIGYYRGLESEGRGELDRLTEHSSSVHLGAVFVVLMASFMFPGCTWRLRVSTLIVSVPGLIVFALSQRRSAAVGLGVGVILLLVVVARLRPARLIWIVPTVAVISVGYLAAFWNTSGPVGFGAQAVKSVIAPDQLDNIDRSSNMYRQLEAFNLWFTIRAQPITGVGFGNVFYQPWPLPFLAGFEFRAFIPHNNILWVWLKLGAAGFVTTLFFVGRSVQLGAKSVVHLARGDTSALMMGAVAYVMMFTVFAYVDIAWDARSTVFLAVTIAWCADFVSAEDDVDEAMEVGAVSHERWADHHTTVPA